MIVYDLACFIYRSEPDRQLSNAYEELHRHESDIGVEGGYVGCNYALAMGSYREVLKWLQNQYKRV